MRGRINCQRPRGSSLEYIEQIVSSRCPIILYYIQSSIIKENIDEIYCIFYIFTSENIKFYIYTPPECFWITSYFSIDLLQCTSEQTPTSLSYL